MSIQVIDAENLIQTAASAPDPLRAEIGEYYSSITNKKIHNNIGRSGEYVPRSNSMGRVHKKHGYN